MRGAREGHPMVHRGIPDEAQNLCEAVVGRHTRAIQCQTKLEEGQQTRIWEQVEQKRKVPNL